MHFSELWNLLKTTAPFWGPLLSGLIAAFIVHLLTQSRERERWILDCKKQEFKELLSAVSASWHATTNAYSSPFRTADEEEQRRVQSITEDCLRTMRDRLYITNDLPLDDFANRWSEALATYANRRRRLDGEFDRIRNAIIAANKKAVPKTNMQRLKFWKR